ncbi:MAG: tRNA dihydrouridine synthase DusB [Elusimicrobia bacterium]|jgi:tRNA-dihydrouridine synthase B|nr:tRNA dihydrouridine synthase DusB [Elusimicrobiota bacterium]
MFKNKSKLKIGNLKLASRVLLAPMAGITDYPYRKLYRQFGCKTAFTEMINARSLTHLSKKTMQMLYTDKEDSPLGVQLVGNDPEYITGAIKELHKMDFDFIDLNAGCPVKKVVNNGSGSALLKNPEKLARILKIIKANTDLPVTVKIRTGWNRENKNSAVIAKTLSEAGADAISVHGRTKAEMYRGSVDYQSIKQAVDASSVPVLASGNIFTPQQVKNMFQKTGCAGVLVARGSYGNPCIFNDIHAYLSGKPLPAIRPAAKVGDIMYMHLNYIMDFYGNDPGYKIYRKHINHYTRYFTHAKGLREKVFRSTRPEDIQDIIEEFKETAACYRHPYLASV